MMFFHFTPPHPAFFTPLIDNAYVFVGFFFLISGFVLAYNYADRPNLSRRAFYLARLSRVYPVYLLVLLLSIPFLAQEWPAHSAADFYLGLILTPLALQAWSPTLATFWNTVAWTVPAEFLLYALFPFILLLIRRHDHASPSPATSSSLSSPSGSSASCPTPPTSSSTPTTSPPPPPVSPTPTGSAPSSTPPPCTSAPSPPASCLRVFTLLCRSARFAAR